MKTTAFKISPADKRAMLSRMWLVCGFSFITTLALWAKDGFGWQSLVRQTVYSFSISLLIWLLTDLGMQFHHKKTGHRLPSGWRRVVFLGITISTGYVLGTLVGDWYSGWSTWALFSTDKGRFSGILLMSAAISLGFVGYFYQKEQLAKVQRQAAESQLKLLETQLEPHMLFNTLANLRVLINTDPARASTMLDHLVAYLRATLGGSRAVMHPLQLEFDRLRDYLEIMAVRMGPRLRYTLDLPPELANHPVPPLLLQPLVENAIKHGLEPKVEGGSIHVAARLAGDKLLLEVSDSGVGLTGNSTNTNTNTKQQGEQQGFGLTQVSERLATTYGAEFTLNFVANNAYKTCLVATLPYSN